MDGESSSPEGGPDTPPNTPVTPSHKTSKEHHKQWKESEKCEPEPAACLGQHHHQRHHHHHKHHHSHKHHNHSSDFDKKSSHSPQGLCDARSSNDPLSVYSCYHAHWCAASTSSTPIPSPTPTSPSHSLSSNCSSEGETRWQSSTRHRSTEKAERSTSNRKSVSNDDDDDDDDEDDADQNSDQDQDQDHSGKLPNPGTRPTTPPGQNPSNLYPQHSCETCSNLIFLVHLVTFARLATDSCLVLSPLEVDIGERERERLSFHGIRSFFLNSDIRMQLMLREDDVQERKNNGNSRYL